MTKKHKIEPCPHEKNTGTRFGLTCGFWARYGKHIDNHILAFHLPQDEKAGHVYPVYDLSGPKSMYENEEAGDWAS